MSMNLAEFIIDNLEPILAEWEKYAKSMPAAAALNTEALRDHAEQMLKTIAADIGRPQTDKQQEEKSKGFRPHVDGDTAAEEHASGRQADGFSLSEMVSEYRALRASVVRLWTREMQSADRDTLDDVTRFNEAIDQALTESTHRYSERLDQSRELFLGVLGHDLRSPLGAVMNSAEYLMHAGTLTGPQIKATSVIVRSGTRIRDMIADLLDVTSTRLGKSLPINPEPTELESICRQVIEEAQAYHPDRVISLNVSGSFDGTWDESRIGQLLSNLVENAIQHGAANKPVTVSLEGGDNDVTLSVHNEGKPIPKPALWRIFEPLAQHEQRHETRGKGGGLGLGLYIASAIVHAHHGSIDVESSGDAGTTFTARLPRDQ